MMKQYSIGQRGQLFIFDDLVGFSTHVYVIIGEEHVFVIDTYLGASYIEPVLKYLEALIETRKTVIVNTHYDWDHIWGNSAFPQGLFVAHDLFSKELGIHFAEQLKENQKYIRDQIEIPIPNITFSEKITFLNERVGIFHSPGHTSDSISIYDSIDQVLIVGDNVEEPELYENDVSREIFINTLESYKKYPFRYLIAGHYWSEDDKTLTDNISKLKAKN